MRKWQTVCGVALAFTLLTSGSPASAQFGVGLGVGGWGNYWNDWGNFFGAWIEIRPWSRPYDQPPRQGRQAAQANGTLEGQVNIQATSPASQPNVACPLMPADFHQITISAEPYNASQWLSSHPDAQGRYRLSLPPGGYNVTLHHPALGPSGKALRQIIIQPGQTNRQDFQLELPIQ